jgi:hypothetical protein
MATDEELVEAWRTATTKGGDETTSWEADLARAKRFVESLPNAQTMREKGRKKGQSWLRDAIKQVQRNDDGTVSIDLNTWNILVLYALADRDFEPMPYSEAGDDEWHRGFAHGWNSLLDKVQAIARTDRRRNGDDPQGWKTNPGYSRRYTDIAAHIKK